MTYSLATARKWCNDSEFALVTASYAGKEVTWTPAQLKAKIARTRKLRDKNQDLHRRMRRANRAATGTKSGTQVTAMAVAEKRARLFEETLARFVTKLEKLQARRKLGALKSAVAEAVARKRSALAAPAPGAKRAATTPANAAGRPQARGAAVVPASLRVKRVKQAARVRARNARNQAKRDARGR
jgi:hypothetical protein